VPDMTVTRVVDGQKLDPVPPVGDSGQRSRHRLLRAGPFNRNMAGEPWELLCHCASSVGLLDQCSRNRYISVRG
jgi:hypothetical protein